MLTTIKTILATVRNVLKEWAWSIIAPPFIFWASLFTPAWDFLGDRHSYFIDNIYFKLFPILGIAFIALALLGRQVKFFLFGLVLVFAFPISWGLAYALFGP